jgi:hypothetical protein
VHIGVAQQLLRQLQQVRADDAYLAQAVSSIHDTAHSIITVDFSALVASSTDNTQVNRKHAAPSAVVLYYCPHGTFINGKSVYSAFSD